MTLNEIQAKIEAIARNARIREAKNFEERAAAIDLIKFPVIACLEEFTAEAGCPDDVLLLKHSAENLKTELEEVDTRLFEQLREKLSKGKALKDLVREYVD